MRPPASGEEGECLGNEGLMMLENAAVARIFVDSDFRSRDAPRQIDRVGSRNHQIVLAVGDKRQLLDDSQILRRLRAPRVDRF